MNKPKAQGTSWETALVRQCQAAGLLADRMPEGGSWDCGDLWIGDVPGRFSHDIPIVAWSRLVKSDGTRRIADGARSVVVMSTEDFLTIAFHAVNNNVAFIVEAKATERLNVTRVLDQAQRKYSKWKARH